MKILSFDVGIINMAYCIIDNDKNIHSWNVFSICNGNEIENTIDLIRKLDQWPEILDVDIVLIEKQPPCNPKMRIVAESVRSYMIFRGIVDNNKNFKMKNYSPKHKLSCYTGQMPPELVATPDMLADRSISGKSKLYRLRKKQSIFHTEKLIADQDKEMRELYQNAQKKKDDLADSYLQALSWVMFENSAKTKDVCQRVPTKKQERYKKYSKSNLKYLLVRHFNETNRKDVMFGLPKKDPRETLSEWVRGVNVIKSIKMNYGTNWDLDEIENELLPLEFLETDNNIMKT